MKVELLDHSGFLVEIEDTALIFDYTNPKGDAGVVAAQDLARYKKSYVFFSHSHGDHYCAEGLALPATEVFISKEFRKGTAGTRMRVGETAEREGLTVRAFGSTDSGVSYLVDVCGKRVFHAGDLNLWHWEDESTQEEIEEAGRGFEAVMQTLAPYADTVDLAFFPLDTRMGRNTSRGIDAFNARMRPRALIPMHAFGDTRIYADYAAAHENVTALTARGMQCTL